MNLATKQILDFKDNSLIPLLFGAHNAHLLYIEDKLDVSISDRGNELTLSGKPAGVQKAETVLNYLWEQVEGGTQIDTAEIDAALRFIGNKKNKNTNAKKKMTDQKITIKTKKKSIHPRSPNQAKYLKAIQEHEMAFGLGPAGTGKTYLAVAVGVSMFLEGKVEKLIFTRPAVEAGENLGFLPGDMKDKVDPYLRPIYDALNDMLPMDFVLGKIESGEIEIAPLAFMRGRTLSNAFVILDEAQNTTTTQMKMFLTRMGESSRMVITGDQSQTDLPKGVRSGLRDAVEILEGVEDIYFNTFKAEDVIRHHLVSKIVHAYDQKS